MAHPTSRGSMRRSFYVAGALVLSAGVLQAQGTARSRSRSDDGPVRVYSYDNGRFQDDRDRAAIGVTTSSGGMRDTLGLLVTSVTAGGPAEKAGLEEGNRLVSINGVSLKLSREDADDDYMQGVNQNRLQREMRKVKAGDDVRLDVYAGGRSRQVTVKTVSAEDLSPRRVGLAPSRDDDRAALGLYLTTTGS